MTAKKLATKAPATWDRGERGIRQRLAWAFRAWCAAEGVATSSATDRLRKGWPKGAPLSRAAVQEWAGSERHPIAVRIPSGRTLAALCERMGVSADWLFTGRGPERREARVAGGVLSHDELAREVAVHVRGELAVDQLPLRTHLRHIDGAACLEAVVALARRQFEDLKTDDATTWALNVAILAAKYLTEGDGTEKPVDPAKVAEILASAATKAAVARQPTAPAGGVAVVAEWFGVRTAPGAIVLGARPPSHFVPLHNWPDGPVGALLSAAPDDQPRAVTPPPSRRQPRQGARAGRR